MTEQTHDWSILDIPGVRAVVAKAAKWVSWDYGLEAADLEQEGVALVCDLRTNLPECVAGERVDLGLLYHRLVQDLLNMTEKYRDSQPLNSSFELRYDEPGDGEQHSVPYAPAEQRPFSLDYDRDLVESLIPAIWDENFCYGVKVENAPDKDMPKGSTSKATGNTLAAHIADIKVGWKTAPLTRRERQAIFLHIGLDWSQREAAFNLGISQQNVSEHVIAGIGKIVAELNGDGALMTYLVTGETEEDREERVKQERLDYWLGKSGLSREDLAS